MESSDSSSIVPLVFGLVFGIITILAMWKVYAKAGKPGWGALVPFYNSYLLVKIAGKPGWWWFLFFVPLINLVIYFVVQVGIAKAFNRSAVFGIFLLGIFPVIGYCILGFGKATYSSAPTSPSINTTPAATPPTPLPQQPKV